MGNDQDRNTVCELPLQKEMTCHWLYVYPVEILIMQTKTKRYSDMLTGGTPKSDESFTCIGEEPRLGPSTVLSDDSMKPDGKEQKKSFS